MVSAGKAAAEGVSAAGEKIKNLIFNENSESSDGGGQNTSGGKSQGEKHYPEGVNPENLESKPGKIGEALGVPVEDVKDAIHEVKRRLPKGTGVRNPDVQVDVTTGEVYPEIDKGRGGVGDSIGNILDELDL